MRTIASASEGVYHHRARLDGAAAEMLLRALAGEADDDKDAHHEARMELGRLEVLGWRVEAAHTRLTQYADAALAAHSGLGVAALVLMRDGDRLPARRSVTR